MPDDLLSTFRARLRTEDGPALRSAIEAAVLTRRDEGSRTAAKRHKRRKKRDK